MNVAALLLYVLFAAVAIGARTLVQWRRTGDTGLRMDAGPAGSLRWWAKIAFVAAIALSGAGPIAGMAGLKPLSFLDRPAWQWTGIALAVVGIAATAAAQLAMGNSWRIGVDPSEKTALVIGGPFALARNPIFTAFLVASAGLTLMVGNIVAVLGFMALLAAVEMQVRLVEEPYLSRLHGAEYGRYASRVGRFVPLVGRLGVKSR
ncbi:MAG TPA: isoprenylcysteine carboxyl methyltransferase [Micromonosporaceae bacterium]|nr:isoprenylcysteine carboxyl methyltransferase [Micromonosporaceae bacterium]HCU48296.1 isoprenylcysteine carboxyl methyltransferase [Micromonosporaceae bacterium]